MNYLWNNFVTRAIKIKIMVGPDNTPLPSYISFFPILTLQGFNKTSFLTLRFFLNGTSTLQGHILTPYPNPAGQIQLYQMRYTVTERDTDTIIISYLTYF